MSIAGESLRERNGHRRLRVLSRRDGASPVRIGAKQEKPTRAAGGLEDGSGIRESNPSHSLGKAGHSRYTNPADTGIISARSGECNGFTRPGRQSFRSRAAMTPEEMRSLL